MEPVPANTGLILPEKEYLSNIRRITKEKNIVLIFDEVITRFRLALSGASEFLAFQPILLHMQPWGTGFLLELSRARKVMEQFAPMGKLYQANAFAGNPTSSAAVFQQLRL